MTSHFSGQFDAVKYNHFHEWEEDNDELFEIIPLPPTPDPSDSEAIPSPPPPTRATKFRNVIKLVTGKKAKKTGGKSQETQSDWSGNRHATLPRMNREEREARIRYLRDEVFGLGRFYQESDPTKLYESEDPTPFVPKTVRWKSDPAGGRNMGTVDLNVNQGSHDVESEVYNDSAASENNKRRKDNPYWEEEFELPEPELAYNPNSPSQHGPQAKWITIDLSDVLTSEFADEPPHPTSPLDLSKKVTDTNTDSVTDYSLNNSKLGCNCGDPLCNAFCVHVLTVKGIQENLGQEIADLIVTEMILRLGPPLPLPTREVNESQAEILAVRKAAVVQMYAKWAATFTFQKLIVAIKLSLDHFKPSHRGIVNFEFQDYQVFKNIDVKTKYLVIRKMRAVFDEHVRVLQNKCPKDAIFRQKIIGAPFWAEGQEYRFTPAGNYSGVLLNYKIKRGGIGIGEKAASVTTRESV